MKKRKWNQITSPAPSSRYLCSRIEQQNAKSFGNKIIDRCLAHTHSIETMQMLCLLMKFHFDGSKKIKYHHFLPFRQSFVWYVVSGAFLFVANAYMMRCFRIMDGRSRTHTRRILDMIEWQTEKRPCTNQSIINRRKWKYLHCDWEHPQFDFHYF